MGRIFRIVDEAEEYQRGYNQRESDDKMLERAFKEGCEHGYKKAMREAGFDERGGSGQRGSYRGSYREGFEEKIEKLKERYR